MALLGCLVGGSLTAYYLWNAHQQELARQAALLEEQRRLAELAEKNAQAKQPLDLASLQKPWTLMPDLEDMLRACSKATGYCRCRSRAGSSNPASATAGSWSPPTTVPATARQPT